VRCGNTAECGDDTAECGDDTAECGDDTAERGDDAAELHGRSAGRVPTAAKTAEATLISHPRRAKRAPMLGIIGGSGLYDLPGLADVRRERVSTPFGEPSDEIVVGSLGEQQLAFLPRHGKGHRLTPTEINVRANIYALKKLGCTRVVSVSAVGSMKEEIVPGHLVLPDQYIDTTYKREKSFFGDGIVAHVAFADPICGKLQKHLEKACFAANATVHVNGTYLCIEGPHFSTRAESNLYRSWGISVIGMTAMPEAKLAREAELCYATIALATDYDCWHDSHESVTVAQVVATMQKNVATAKEVLRNAALALGRLGERDCPCAKALDSAVMTAPNLIPAKARERLELFLKGRPQA
jgi:5'-methylthioadenosine phosphorylase